MNKILIVEEMCIRDRGAKAFGVFSCEQGDRTMIYSKQSMVSSVAIVIGTLM